MAYEYELLDVITRDQLCALQTRYRGTRLYVPLRLPADHPIARLIGYPAAKKLSAEFAGCLFPISGSLLVRRRNAQIRAERALGAPPAAVARRYGLTTRAVRRICQGLARDTTYFGLRRRQGRALQQGLEWHDRKSAQRPDSTHGRAPGGGGE